MTLGVPAAVTPPPGTAAVERGLASIQGCEGALVGSSTLHLFWDVLGMVASEPVAILLDDGAYPIARWGVERAAARGVPVRRFRHHDRGALERAVRDVTRLGRRPLIVADGLCPGCGGPAPLAAYAAIARRHGGALLLDDTQSLGILGSGPTAQRPYGGGGGGSVRHAAIEGPGVLVVASLAKGFGVPLAALSGTLGVIRKFEARSETRVHCSPPAIPLLLAAMNALQWNTSEGETRRAALCARVREFRRQMRDGGWTVNGGYFPVQTLTGLPPNHAAEIHQALLRRGVRSVLHMARAPKSAAISFLLTARHTAEEISLGTRVIVDVFSAMARSEPGARVRS
ncbi:MAG TPA: aminotransferase class I/II-fold pyridoxal phosphate-dependent enzyme [Acidobacteriota bacterium]|nr:aminotransferase class I/II-fold pyridoxal phosphate-dependent enzyme [Acidobacteriota bacterium]